MEIRETIRDIMNKHINYLAIAEFFGFYYCKVCGNYNFKEDFIDKLDGNYTCPHCDCIVLSENIVKGLKK